MHALTLLYYMFAVYFTYALSDYKFIRIQALVRPAQAVNAPLHGAAAADCIVLS